MLNDLDITPDDPAELRAVNRLLADEVKSQALLIEKLKHQLAGQNRHRIWRAFRKPRPTQFDLRRR